MNDTVTKLLELVSEYAEHYAEDRKWGTFTADTTKARQALQDELTRLFTPLPDEQIHAAQHSAPYVEGEDKYVRVCRAVEREHGITARKQRDDI